MIWRYTLAYCLGAKWSIYHRINELDPLMPNSLIALADLASDRLPRYALLLPPVVVGAVLFALGYLCVLSCDLDWQGKRLLKLMRKRFLKRARRNRPKIPKLRRYIAAPGPYGPEGPPYVYATKRPEGTSWRESNWALGILIALWVLMLGYILYVWIFG